MEYAIQQGATGQQQLGYCCLIDMCRVDYVGGLVVVITGRWWSARRVPKEGLETSEAAGNDSGPESYPKRRVYKNGE